MANVQKFLFLGEDGQLKQQTSLDTIQIANGVNSADAVNKGQLDAVEAALESALSTEQAAREAADVALGGRIDTEISDRQAAISGLASDLSDEVSRATAAEQTIAADLATEISDRQTAITNLNSALSADILAEQTRAEAAESALSSSLTQEISDRTAAVLAEKTRAEGVEADLLAAINTEITDRTQAVADEASARAAGDLAEKNRAEGVEADLQSQITQEVADRQAAITSISTSLSADLTAEVNRATAAEGVLQTNIDNEASARAAAITAEETARIAGDAALASDLADEVARAMGAESDLSAAISQEASDRAAAVSAEQSRAEGVEAQLASDIAGETTARIQAVSAEQTRAEGAEAQLASDLSDETAARIAGDASTLAEAKTYADGLVSGVTFKNSVRVALPYEFEMGGSTISLPADFMSIKGPAGLDAGDRILLINKDDGSTSVVEGIYVVNPAGTALVRAPDMIVGSDASGVLCYVEEGTLGSNIPCATPGTSFVCTNVKGGDIVGTDALGFAVFSRAEALNFQMGIEKDGLDVSLKLSGESFFVIDENMALTATLDGTYLGVVDGSLTMQGALVSGKGSSADELHIHKHAACVKPCSVSAGSFVKPDMTGATWNSPAVFGLVELDGPNAGEKVIVVSGLAGEGLPAGALDAFSIGDVVYLGGTAGSFSDFAGVPSGKYAVPVGRKCGASEIVVQIGGAPALKA